MQHKSCGLSSNVQFCCFLVHSHCPLYRGMLLHITCAWGMMQNDFFIMFYIYSLCTAYDAKKSTGHPQCSEAEDSYRFPIDLHGNEWAHFVCTFGYTLFDISFKFEWVIFTNFCWPESACYIWLNMSYLSSFFIPCHIVSSYHPTQSIQRA